MLSHSNSESPAADSVCGWIVRQQADKLMRMNILGDLAQEHQEEDRRARDEEAAWTAEARVTRKATKKAKQKAWELNSEESPPWKKKARVQANGTGASVVPMVEANEGMEFPEAPCKRCVSWLTY